MATPASGLSAVAPAPASPRRGEDASARPGLVLRFNRIYILPTRQGLGLAGAVCVMLLGAINYGNALGYALCFMLVSTGLVSMLHAVRNLAGLRLTRLPSDPVFAGDRARFRLRVDNAGGRRRFAIVARLATGGRQSRQDDPVTHFALDADGACAVELSATAARRGWYAPGRVVLATRFPFGWFRAWSRNDLGLACLVYPRPEGTQPLPDHQPETRGEHGARGRGDDEFSGLRDYQQGDSAHRIHWKAVAREQGIPVKIFSGASSGITVLRWQDVIHGDTESRLAQLCRWVVDADAGDLRYGLSLPGIEIAPASGEQHRRQCLEALALYDREPAR